MMLSSCSHSFCKACLKLYVKICAEQGDAQVMCPKGSSCDTELTQSDLRALTDPKTFTLLDRRALERAVELDPTLHLCASPDCPYVVCWTGPDDGESLFDCPLCNHKRCIVCGQEPFHTDSLCPVPGDGVSWSPSSSSPPPSSIVPIEDRLLLLSMNVKRCRRCGQGVLKESGCHKVKCRCGYRFCFICLSENAQCNCTPESDAHGFIDNVTGRVDSSRLKSRLSPT